MSEDDLNSLRVCRSCDCERRLADFPLTRGRRFYRCIRCCTERSQKWAEHNRDRSARIKTAWKERNPEKRQAANTNYARSDRGKDAARKWKNENAGHLRELAKKRYRNNPNLQREATRRYQLAHPDRPKKKYAANQQGRGKRSTQYYENNKATIIGRVKAWKLANPEQPEITRARAKAWRDKNPEKCRSALARRRKQLKVKGDNYTAQDIKRLRAVQKNLCAEPTCRKDIGNKYHVDHVMPLSKGGSNAPDNIQLLCPQCNLQKQAKDPYEWAQSKGRLF